MEMRDYHVLLKDKLDILNEVKERNNSLKDDNLKLNLDFGR